MWPFRSKERAKAAQSRGPSDFGPFEAVYGPDLAYLSLLHLRNDKAQGACKTISELVESNSDSSLYIQLMLEDVNWRPHLVACIAVLVSQDSNEYVAPMWAAFDAGSWVAPQLAVTLSFCDSNFEENAKLRVSDGGTVSPPSGLSAIERHSATGPAGSLARSGKNTASLIEILSIMNADADWLTTVRTKPKTQKLLAEDFDNSAEIARRWTESIRETLEPLGVGLVH